ncbi:hypothetical protein [Rugosimonospora africana]|uniref:hypothetical protein n=1 Tax=Rugosimonospora africana TaxID=556532 RepID=UPI001940B8A7|nr:hypothetical protein [Rugosimonospora africana]
MDEVAARYAVTSVDDDGRLADRSILTFLGWAPGQPIDLAIEPGPIVDVRLNGNTAINSRGFLRIPLPLRRRCGIAPRDRVLVAAYQRPQELLIIPMSTADDLVRAYRRSHLDGATP